MLQKTRITFNTHHIHKYYITPQYNHVPSNPDYYLHSLSAVRRISLAISSKTLSISMVLHTLARPHPAVDLRTVYCCRRIYGQGIHTRLLSCFAGLHTAVEPCTARIGSPATHRSAHAFHSYRNSPCWHHIRMDASCRTLD